MAAPPPTGDPPPLLDEEANPLVTASYQGNFRAVPPPKIRNDNVDPPVSSSFSYWWNRLREASNPNIGQTNSYALEEGAVLLQWRSLHEWIPQVRWWLSSLSVVAAILLITKLVWEVLVFQWTRGIRTLIALLLDGLLGTSEMLAVWDDWKDSISPQQSTASSAGDSSQQHPQYYWIRQLQSTFGFVYHPIGKPLFLLFLSLLCWSIPGLLVNLVGVGYSLAAAILAILSQYDEFARTYYPVLPDDFYMNNDGENEDRVGDFPVKSWSVFSSTSSAISNSITRLGGNAVTNRSEYLSV